MAFDRYGEAIRALEGGIPDVPFSLTRRRRFLVVATDEIDGFAGVWFIRRGHSGEPTEETVRLRRSEAGWQGLGGGSSSSGSDFFAPRPERKEVAEVNAQRAQYRALRQTGATDLVFRLGGGGSARSAPRVPWRQPPFVWSSQLRFARGCESILIDGRQLRIARHGYVMVLWTARKPPTITVLDNDGDALGSVTLEHHRRRRRPVWPRVARGWSGTNRRFRRSRWPLR